MPWRAYGWAVAAVLCSTAIDHVLSRSVAEVNLILVYLVGMLPVALRGDRGAAMFSAILAVGAFDFFFVAPHFTFAVSETQYLFTFLAMGLVGGIISWLTARLAAEISASRQREAHAETLNLLSRAMLAARDPHELLAEGARVMAQEIRQPVGAWLRRGPEEPVAAIALPQPLTHTEHSALLWVLREGLPAGPTTGSHLESSYLFVPIRNDRKVLGAIGVHWPAGGVPLEPEARAMLETGANQMATALEQARAREEAETGRLRSALLSAVSHDLRTPLTGIVGAASSLVDGATAMQPEVRIELAQSIVEEGERLNRLVTNLLNATRLVTGPIQLTASWFPLEDALSPALSRLASALARHPVAVELADDLPLIHADPLLIEQVFANLLENASKHAPAGTPVSVRAWQLDREVIVEVRDRGPGLPPGAEKAIFEMFRRLPAAGAVSGSGLGLSICKGIVEAHGGQITAETPETGGAVFRFSLPVSDPPPRASGSQPLAQ